MVISSIRTGYGKYGFCTVHPLFWLCRADAGCGIIIIHLVAYFPNINVNRTEADAPAAAHALDPVIIFVHIIFQLVHEPLASPAVFLLPGVMAGSMNGKQGKHAAVPVPHPDSRVSLVFILNIKTPAGGAGIGAGTAIDAGKSRIFPERRIIDFVVSLALRFSVETREPILDSAACFRASIFPASSACAFHPAAAANALPFP